MIYVIAPETSCVVKIGYTSNKPAGRIGTLQTGNPERLVVRWATEGEESLERHLHAVFKDYRVRGEWFDLSPLGDPVQAVRDEVDKARHLLAKGEGLLVGERFRDTSLRADWDGFDEAPDGVIWDPEVPPQMRRGSAIFIPLSNPAQSWDERFPPVQRPQSWDERFPPPAPRPAAGTIVRRSMNGEDPKPGCIRVWKGRCRRPSGTTCDGC